jgi:hypothetical protein
MWTLRRDLLHPFIDLSGVVMFGVTDPSYGLGSARIS